MDKDSLIRFNQYTLVTRHLIMPNELNPNFSIFGGQLMAWLDKDLYVFASGELKYKNMVTISMNKVYFKNPAYLGEVIEIYGALSKIRRSSVTTKGRAIAVDPETEERRTIIECEITYVAVNKDGKPQGVFKNLL